MRIRLYITLLETELACFYEDLMSEVGLIYLKASPLSGLKIE